MIYLILILYIGFVFIGSLRGARSMEVTPEGYFLANRGLGTLTLFFTILATNFSAFYFLGFAGAGYRVGYAHFVIMSLGTAFAGLSFYFIGSRVWRLGKEHGCITPAELVHVLSGSSVLRYVFALVMVIFTFPYLALQIIGAGYILESLTGGSIPYLVGAGLLTLFTIAYTWIGGMTSVAKTDLKQGLLMIILMTLAVIVIANSLGGISSAHATLLETHEGLFSREGVGQSFPPKKWFSLLVFWFFCIPMFPQIFTRFYIADSLSTLKKSAVLYALIPLIISILPVVVGVLGHLTFPDLTGKETDQILPMMLAHHAPEWFSALVMTGALAAFMSTLDSQLLALSTMVTRDFVLPLRRDLSLSQQVKVGRRAVVAFAMVGLLIAARPFDTIDDMGKLAFAGLSILFPAAYALLRWKTVEPFSALLSIIVGEGLLVGFHLGWLPAGWTLGFDSYIVILILCFGILIIGRLLSHFLRE